MATSKTLVLLALFATVVVLSIAFDPKENTRAGGEEEAKFRRFRPRFGRPPVEASETNTELYGGYGGGGGYAGRYGHQGGGGYGHGGGGYGHGGGGYGHGGGGIPVKNDKGN